MPNHAFADFVRSNLPVRPVPAVPEIMMHVADPRSGLRRWAARAGYAVPPYWAHPWSGGVVLARFLLDAPERIAGRTVTDLGTGSGLVGIAACRAGAAHVSAVDIDPYALVVAGLNARLNRVSLDTRAGDATQMPVPPCDLILCGDLFYEAALARSAAAYLGRCAGAGVTVLVGDPGRAHLPLSQLEPIASSPVPDFGSAGMPSISTVYRFHPG